MTWRLTSYMTRKELEQHVEQLRDVVDRLAAQIPSVAESGSPKPATGREMYARLARSGPPLDITLRKTLAGGFRFGSMKGAVAPPPEDFFGPLTEEELADWEGDDRGAWELPAALTVRPDDDDDK